MIFASFKVARVVVGVAYYVKKWAQAFFAILVVIESKAVAAAKAKASQWAFATVVAWSFFFFCGGVQLFMWLVAKKSSDEFSAATVSLKASTIAVLEELNEEAVAEKLHKRIRLFQ